MNLSNIDSVAQTFDAMIWLQLCWFVRAPPSVVGDQKTAWKPELAFANCGRQDQARVFFGHRTLATECFGPATAAARRGEPGGPPPPALPRSRENSGPWRTAAARWCTGRTR